MKNNSCLLSLLSIILSFFLPAADNRPPLIDPSKYEQLAKFVTKHRCSSEVEDELTKNKNKIEYYKRDFLRSDKYVIKIDAALSRMDNQRRIQQLINEEGEKLSHIAVPKKCITLQDNLLCVVAEFIKPADKKEISLSHAQQLLHFTIKTGLTDWHDENIIFNQHGQSVFIDTEQASFQTGSKFRMWLLSNEHLSEQARDWWPNGEKRLWHEEYNRIDQDPKYDDPEIDFQQVQNEYRQKRIICIKK